MQSFIPDNWKDLKINGRSVFINSKESLLCFHPPFHFDNLQLFLDLYQYKLSKEDLLLLINQKSESNPKNIKVLTVSENTSPNQSKRNSLSFDSEPIKEVNKLKIIENFWTENTTDLLRVLKKVFSEKYTTVPNFEYTVEKDKITKYTCCLKVRQDFQLVYGESLISKIKAREDSVKKGLKLLVPSLYTKFVDEQLETKVTESSLFSINSSSNNSKSAESLHFTNSSLLSEIGKLSPNRNHDFLKRKRKKEVIESDDEDDCIFGGCLVDNNYAELRIDDPLVVDKYLKCSNFTPLNILNTYKTYNPKVDVREKVFTRNDGIKFENIKNDNFTKVCIESQTLKIYVESSSDNKKSAREYAAQKFLKKIYKEKFSNWVDLVKYYEDRVYIKDKI